SETSAFSATNSAPGAVSSNPGDAPAGNAVGFVTRTSTYFSSACPGAICSSSGAIRRSMDSRTCASRRIGSIPYGARRSARAAVVASIIAVSTSAAAGRTSRLLRAIALPSISGLKFTRSLVDTNHHPPVFGTGAGVGRRAVSLQSRRGPCVGIPLRRQALWPDAAGREEFQYVDGAPGREVPVAVETGRVNRDVVGVTLDRDLIALVDGRQQLDDAF